MGISLNCPTGSFQIVAPGDKLALIDEMFDQEKADSHASLSPQSAALTPLPPHPPVIISS